MVQVTNELHDIVKERVMIGHGASFFVLVFLTIHKFTAKEEAPYFCQIRFVSQSAQQLCRYSFHEDHYRKRYKPMSQIPSYSYDKEADVLYISFAPGEKATAAVELNENILLRFNRTDKRVIGLTLMDFSVLVQLTRLGPRNFPLTGLLDLDPEWQELVIDLITTSPINQILHVSSYTPSPIEMVPITSVSRPPVAV